MAQLSFALQVATALTVLASVGCGGTMIHVSPTPPEAMVYLDGKPTGKGPTDVELLSEEKTYSLRIGGIGGFFDHTMEITAETLSPVEVELHVDNSFAQTVDGEGQLNQWLMLPVAKHYDEDDVWRKVTRAISAATTDFKQIERESMTLRTAWQVAGRSGDWRRTASRIVIRPGSREKGALKLKVMIESRLIDSDRKKAGDADRTFKPYLEALAEARVRLAR